MLIPSHSVGPCCKVVLDSIGQIMVTPVPGSNVEWPHGIFDRQGPSKTWKTRVGIGHSTAPEIYIWIVYDQMVVRYRLRGPSRSNI